MTTHYVVCGFSPNITGLGSSDVKAIFPTENDADTQRDAWAASDLAAAEAVYGESNVRLATSTDGKVKEVIYRVDRSKEHFPGIVLDNKPEYIYSSFMTDQYTNP